MTFPEWMTMVEQAGASMNGVDMNWLQHQYQTNQQPSLIAQMINAGHAPRPMMGQPMMQPMYQPMYQPGYQQPAKPKGGGFSTFMNIFMGILGFAAIVGMILYGLMLLSKQANPETKGRKLTIEGGGTSTYDPPPYETLKAKGLDPTVAYPYWPVVYDTPSMKAAPDIIMGKVTNYGDKPVKNVTVHFGLYLKNGDKVGTAEDMIAVLEPNATWDYRAKVNHNYDQCRLDDITFSK